MDMWSLMADSPLEFYFILSARLVLACLLGGIIGYERENMRRPAGFRTHILVCVGAALVMVTSEFIFQRYKGTTNIDPARLGAQVISGIGFLGAGTIIREGFNVKGLTTAASLWAVSCVGIAVGIGFYEGAIASTLIIYITLILLKRWEESFSAKSHSKVVCIQSENSSGQINQFSLIFKKFRIAIKNIELTNDEPKGQILIKYHVSIPGKIKREDLIEELKTVNGVQKIFEE